eukprot:463142_1
MINISFTKHDKHVIENLVHKKRAQKTYPLVVIYKQSKYMVDIQFGKNYFNSLDTKLIVRETLYKLGKADKTLPVAIQYFVFGYLNDIQHDHECLLLQDAPTPIHEYNLLDENIKWTSNMVFCLHFRGLPPAKMKPTPKPKKVQQQPPPDIPSNHSAVEATDDDELLLISKTGYECTHTTVTKSTTVRWSPLK